MSPAMNKNILPLSILCTAVAVALCSCGMPDVGQAQTQNAARLNSEQVTPHRIESVLARNDDVMAAQVRSVAALAPERSADLELLAHGAVEARLDDDVHVAQAIERAKRQILAQAYIEQAVTFASQADPPEIASFYVKNPALFGQRRIYRMRELVVVGPPGSFGALQDVVARAENLAVVVRWLDSRKLAFETARHAGAAEQIPMNILRRLFEMRDGQLAVFPTPNGVSVVLLEQSVESPVSEQQARPAIARYLLNRKRLELAHAAVENLREHAKIHHDGIEALRPATVAQTALRIQPPVAQAGLARDTSGFDRLR